MSFQRIRTFDNVAKPFVRLVEKCYPDAFIFVIILSILTYFLAITIAGASHAEAITAWGEGLPKLFTFTAQITLFQGKIMIVFRKSAKKKSSKSLKIIFFDGIR